MHVKAIVFDFNGLFVQPIELKIVENICRQTGLGRWIALSNYYFNINAFEEGRLSPNEFWNKVFVDLNREQYTEWVEQAYEKSFYRNAELYVLAEKLSGNYTVYCLSNSNFLQGKAYRKQKLYMPFRQVFLSHEIHRVKPFPRAFKYFLAQTSLAAKECLFIDNELRNAMAAKLLGFRTVRFRDNAQLVRELESQKVL